MQINIKAILISVNSIMFNNSEFGLLEILSYINFINTHHTDEKILTLREMKNTVTAVYNRIQETREHKRLKELLPLLLSNH